MTLGVLPMMTQAEANALLRGKYKPIDWMSPRMVAAFWDSTRPAVAAAASRGHFDRVQRLKLGKLVFWDKYKILSAWAPNALTEETRFEILRTIPDLLKAEVESGIYGVYTPDEDPVMPEIRQAGYVEHAKYQDDLPRFDMRIPKDPILEPIVVELPPVPKPSPKEKRIKAKKARDERKLKEATRYPARKKFEQSYLEAMADIVTLHDWENIVVCAINQATGGDAKARTWISDYLIGKPITRIAAIQKIENTVMGEDERATLMQALLTTQLTGENILDVEPLNAVVGNDESNGADVSDSAQVGGRRVGSEHVVVSTSEE